MNAFRLTDKLDALLMFSIANRGFALRVEDVAAITTIRQDEYVASDSDYLSGIFKLPGLDVPIVRIAGTPREPVFESAPSACILVKQNLGKILGIMSGTLPRLSLVQASDIEPAVSIGFTECCIKAVVRHQDDVRFLIDIEELLPEGRPFE